MDTSCEAEYADGFILNETNLDDANPFDGEGNTFTAILKRLAEPEHGKMVRFSVFWQDRRYDVAWANLPDNARPIRFREGFNTYDLLSGESLESGFRAVSFGYQYNDETGKNHKEILELR